MPSTQSVFHQGSLHYNSACRCYQYLLTSFAGLPSTAGQMEYNCFILFIYPLIIDWVYTDAKSLQSCPTLCDPTRLLCPWDSPGKNAGVGCHTLLEGSFLTQRSDMGLCAHTDLNKLRCVTLSAGAVYLRLLMLICKTLCHCCEWHEKVRLAAHGFTRR